MSRNSHLGDTFNLLQWYVPTYKNQHQAILLHLLGGTGTVRSSTVTINAIQLKRSSASRSVNLQTNRTKTRQFKFTRNQGFTQGPKFRGNEAAVESSGQYADNEANSQATSRSRPNTRQTVKESHLAGHNTNTCFPETRSSWLYTNSAFNSLTKRNVFQQNHT